MDLDNVLDPLPTGPRGVAGGLLARLEREALAEQAALEAAARGERPPSSGAASTSKATAAADSHDDRPTYVPGQKRTNGAAAAPVSSTSTLRDSASAGGSSSVQGAGLAGSSNLHQGTTSNNTHNAATTRGSSPSEALAAKKPRIQPTIRMQFTFPPYPPGKDPIAKHVPIFNVRELAQSKGLLLDPEDEVMDEGSSSGGSDDEGGDEEGSGDNEGGADASMSNTKPKEDETDSQRQLREAIELARRSKKPVLTKKRILDRDEGYDNTDPFVDDSELAINEPKVQARPKVEGYVAIQGEVEVYDNNLPHTKNTEGGAGGADGAGRKGRKAGSINRPKVPMKQPDGSIKMVSEAIAAREAKKSAKSEGRNISGPGAPSSASASPAPVSSTSAKPYGSPGKPSSSSETNHAQSAPPAHNYSSLNPGGLLQERERAPYSHLPSAFGFPDTEEKAAQTPPPPSNGASRASAAPNSAIGSRTSPINIDDADDGDVDMSFGPPGNASSSAFANKPASTSSSVPPPSRPSNVFAFDPSPNKKDGKKLYAYNPVSSTLEAQLDILRAAVSKESFVPKNKFPPAIKPILMETALTAMRTGEYDENFFNIMPNIFPYNRFTMHKMIKREVCEVRCAQLEEEINVHVEELKSELDKVLPENIRAYEDQVEKWKEEYSAWEMQKGTSHGSNNASSSGLATDSHQNGRNSLTPVGSEGDPAPPAQSTEAGSADAGPVKPLPKFKFTQNMRMCLFKIMTLSSEVTERQTEKAQVEEKDPPSAMNATKARYATLVQLWPEGWMTSNQLSRELTQAKKKVASQMNK
ncbi:hypothetical protein P389DRAFT_15260 [Cystobasidium minutum MCA 4210]|uniref:uncharacterized protein n=1 Tax=Cystobasidium minutum MCA 4210 TaxID=1397322 RepID=UPI0034CD6017|eukprot:jgi/Rhomi1/15260/CE15259_760